jgi:uncharacterized protein with FMN-binding domain
MARVVLAIAGTAAVLVFLLSFKTHSTSVAAAPAPSASASPAPTGSAKAKGTSGAASGKRTGTGGSAKTVTGAVADTMYGPVQVAVTVKNGTVTAARAVEYPTQDPRDAQINSYAIPVLNSEAVRAGSARIDTVSGATYTSNGYISSLQSALDKAGR